jgi:hypothetical protein
MVTCDPTDTYTNTTNKGFNRRWNLQKESKVIQLLGRLHAEICNASTYILPGVCVDVSLTKGRREIYLMVNDADSKVTFKVLDARLLVRYIKLKPAILVAHNTTLDAGALAKYHLLRVEVKTFTFASGSQSLSINNDVLGTLTKRLLFTLVKNKNFLGSLDTNPFNFRHYDMRDFSLYINGTQIPSEGLHTYTGREKTTVMGYRTLFEASGIRHSNTVLQITHDIYIAGYFMLLFDLTPDPESVHIRIEAQFAKALQDAVTCLLYLEYDNCVRIDWKRTVTTDFS